MMIISKAEAVRMAMSWNEVDETASEALSRQRTTIEHLPPNWSLRRRVIAAVLLPVTLYFTVMAFGILFMVMSRTPSSLPLGLEWVSLYVAFAITMSTILVLQAKIAIKRHYTRRRR